MNRLKHSDDVQAVDAIVFGQGSAAMLSTKCWSWTAVTWLLELDYGGDDVAVAVNHRRLREVIALAG